MRVCVSVCVGRRGVMSIAGDVHYIGDIRSALRGYYKSTDGLPR